MTLTLTGVDDQGNPVNLTTATAADGSYTFGNLRPSNAAGYAITETQPAGYLDGRDASGTPGGVTGNDVISGIMLHAGVVGTANNFGELQSTSLSGHVYVDANNNGVRDAGEVGIGGVTIALTGADDLGNPVNLTTTTAADGTYQFVGLRPSSGAGYVIVETQPAGYYDGKDAVGTPGGTTLNDVLADIVLPGGFVGINNDFGELAPASLTGRVYVDTDQNGVLGPGEPGIAGVTVALTGVDANGNPISQVVTTGPDGSYAFNNLPPGTYSLTETQPAAYGSGTSTVGSAGGTPGVDRIDGVTLGSGAATAGYNFGELGSTLTGVVSSGGVGQGGASVVVTIGGQTVGAVTTNPDGSYAVPNLPAGVATVTVTAPGPNGTTTTETRPVGIPAGGQAVADFDQTAPPSEPPPVATPGSLSGVVYFDRNNNGSLDAGEPGIPGVTIYLGGFDAAGNFISRQTTTDANGRYTFTELPVGTYTIAEAQPAGYLDGRDSLGTIGGVLSNDRADQIPLASGAAGVNYNFGELAPSSITGTVFLDSNRDGVKGPNEYGMNQITVTLDGVDDAGRVVHMQTVTDVLGNYTFPNLRPGVYSVSKEQPPEFIPGSGTVGSSGGQSCCCGVTGIPLAAGTAANGYNFAELIKPGCILTTDRFRTLLGGAGAVPTGPAGAIPTGPAGAFGRNLANPGRANVGRVLPARPARGHMARPVYMPVAHYLPTLMNRALRRPR